MKKFIAILAILALSCATLTFAEDAQMNTTRDKAKAASTKHHSCNCTKSKYKYNR